MICVGTAIAAMIIVATPLQSVVGQRLVHGKSNAHRASLSILATRDALSSPIIGYGDTRHQQGSVTSIAVGKTAKCKQCGQVSVGNNGQLWLLFICSGFAGAALYLAFFAYGTWRFWRDTSPEGIAGVLVLLLTFVFMIAYDAVGAPLAITMLSYALLWRNEMARRQAAAPAIMGRPGGSNRR
jgi:Kef-type K+ transport system membrane component KefB